MIRGVEPGLSHASGFLMLLTETLLADGSDAGERFPTVPSPRPSGAVRRREGPPRPPSSSPQPRFIHLQQQFFEPCFGWWVCWVFFVLVFYKIAPHLDSSPLFPLKKQSKFLQRCANWKLIGSDPLRALFKASTSEVPILRSCIPLVNAIKTPTASTTPVPISNVAIKNTPPTPQP